MRRSTFATLCLTLALASCSASSSPTSTLDEPTSPLASAPSSTTATTDPDIEESVGNAPDPTPTTTASTTAPTATTPRPQVKTGAQVLVESDFAAIDGKRVGLIAHQVSVVEGEHLGDLLDAATNVELVAMFGPEHGVRGDADAGEYVDDDIDPATEVPVFSLFGPTRQPTPEMLEGIDVLLYDLQDVGVRYYTYISTMGLAMQAAAEANIEFMVLDRPNPQSNVRIGGDVLDKTNTSFVGMYPIRELYGLTAGQLAIELTGGDLDPGYGDVALTVIELDGWTEDMIWEDTGLTWIPPSPALATPTAAYIYPATVYFEATSLSYGRGTDRPFQVFGAPWLDAERVAQELNALPIAGASFAATTITPAMLPGMTVEPAYLGQTIPAISFASLDPYTFDATTASVYLLDAMTEEASAQGINIVERPEWLDRLSGTSLLRTELIGERRPVSEILKIRAER